MSSYEILYLESLGSAWPVKTIIAMYVIVSDVRDETGGNMFGRCENKYGTDMYINTRMFMDI